MANWHYDQYVRLLTTEREGRTMAASDNTVADLDSQLHLYFPSNQHYL